MSRATLFYLSSTALAVVGMWAVLAYGAHLHAPPDLRGYWRINADAANTEIPRDFSVTQSGQFVDVRCAEHTLSGQLHRGSEIAESVTAELLSKDGTRKMYITGYKPAKSPTPAMLSGKFDGAWNGQFVATPLSGSESDGTVR